jgi:hypothetical protein
MIVLKVMGGLGNQMFQIAFARALSLKTSEPLFVDTSVYKKYKIRNYSLEDLFISDYIKNIDVKLNKISIFQEMYHFYQKLHKTLLRTDKIGKNIFIFLSKRGYIFNFDNYYYEVILPNNKNIKSIYGYFKSAIGSSLWGICRKSS